ncbi:hypothetical protein ACGIF2_10240 [Cellulomonas sp. P22]|uniref:hypothetical protein n=1 Tax=Cellulomonas sp. P22 TaxID=3373189 RepID=UPI0037A87148
MERRLELRNRLVAVASLTVGGVVALAGVAQAAPTGEVVVSQTEDLVSGQVLTVTGSGFDESKGVYVAICVDNGPGQTPTPCLGGVDMDGSLGGSAWISSNPPSYAAGLPTAFGPGGTFEVQLPATSEDPVTGVDCREVACAVAVRYDHTRADDRTGDVLVPVSFAPLGTTSAATPEPEVTTTTEGADAATHTQTAPADDTADAAPVVAEDDGSTGAGTALAVGAVVVLLVAAAATVSVRRRRAATAAVAPDASTASTPDRAAD